jgi:integrase
MVLPGIVSSSWVKPIAGREGLEQLEELDRKRRERRERRTRSGVIVPARELDLQNKEELEFWVDELASRDQFKEPFSQASLQGLSREQLIDRVREGIDALTLAPDIEKASGKNWFVSMLGAVGRGIMAVPGVEETLTNPTFQKIMDPIAAFGEMGASTVWGIGESLIPGEQQYERLLREKREEHGLGPQSGFNALMAVPGLGSFLTLKDFVEDPRASIAAQREAWHSVDAPWGTKFAMEMVFDPLNLIPGKVFISPLKFAFKPWTTARAVRKAATRKDGIAFVEEAFTRYQAKGGPNIKTLEGLHNEVYRLKDEANKASSGVVKSQYAYEAKRLELSLDEYWDEMVDRPFGPEAYKHIEELVGLGLREYPTALGKYGPLEPGQVRWPVAGGKGKDPSGHDTRWGRDWLEDIEPKFRKQDVIVVDNAKNEYILPPDKTIRQFAKELGKGPLVEKPIEDTAAPAYGFPFPEPDPGSFIPRIGATGVRAMPPTVGELEFIGPRPDITEFASRYADADATPAVDPFEKGYKAAEPVEYTITDEGVETFGEGLNSVNNYDHLPPAAKKAVDRNMNKTGDGRNPWTPAQMDGLRNRLGQHKLHGVNDRIWLQWLRLTGMRRVELSRILTDESLDRLRNPDNPSMPRNEPVLRLTDISRDVQGYFRETHRPITQEAAEFLIAWIDGKPHKDLPYGGMVGGMGLRQHLMKKGDHTGVFFDRFGSPLKASKEGKFSAIDGFSRRVGAASTLEGMVFTGGSMRHFFTTQLGLSGHYSKRYIANFLGHVGFSNLNKYMHYNAMIQLAETGGRGRSNLAIDADFMAFFRESAEQGSRGQGVAAGNSGEWQYLLNEYEKIKQQMFDTNLPVHRRTIGQEPSAAELRYANPAGNSLRSPDLDGVYEPPFNWDHPNARTRTAGDTKNYYQRPMEHAPGHALYERLNEVEGEMLKLVHAIVPEDARLLVSEGLGKDWSQEVKMMYESYASMVEGYTSVKAFLAVSEALDMATPFLHEMSPGASWSKAKAIEAGQRSISLNNKTRALLNAINLGDAMSVMGGNLAHRYSKMLSELGEAGIDVQVPRELLIMKNQVDQEVDALDSIMRNAVNPNHQYYRKDGALTQAAETYWKNLSVRSLASIDTVPLGESLQEGVRQHAVNAEGVWTTTIKEGTQPYKGTPIVPHLVYQTGDNQPQWIAVSQVEAGETFWDAVSQSMVVADGTLIELRRATLRRDRAHIRTWLEATYHIVLDKDGTSTRMIKLSDSLGYHSLHEIPRMRLKWPEKPGRKAAWTFDKIGLAFLSGTKTGRLLNAGIDVKFANPVGTPAQQSIMRANHTKELQKLLSRSNTALGEKDLWAKLTGTQADGGPPLLVPEGNGEFYGWVPELREYIKNMRQQEGAIWDNVQAAKGSARRSDWIGGKEPPKDGRKHAADGNGEEPPGGATPRNMDDWDGWEYNRMPDGDGYGVEARTIEDMHTDFRDSIYRRKTTNRMKRIFRFPLEWVFGQNMGRTKYTQMIGAHRTLMDVARRRGEQAALRLVSGGGLPKVFGYSAKYGRAMAVTLGDDILEHRSLKLSSDTPVKNAAGEEKHFLSSEKNPNNLQGVSDVEWEARRVINILETPRNYLTGNGTKTYYLLTPEQLEWYDTYHEMVARLQDMATKMGHPLGDYIKGDKEMYTFGPDDWRYVPHPISLISDVAKETSLPKTPILGTRPHFFEARSRENMWEGEFRTGKVYDLDPVSGMKDFYHGTYGFIADQQFMKAFEEFGSTTSHMAHKTNAGIKMLDTLDTGALIEPELYNDAIIWDLFGTDVKKRIENAVQGTKEWDDLREQILQKTRQFADEENALTELKIFGGLRNLVVSNADIARLAYAPDVIKELKDYVRNMEQAAAVQGIMKLPSIWSSYVRTLSTTFDLGAPMIHGFIALVMTPAIAAERGRAAYKAGAGLEKSIFEGLAWHKTPWPTAVRHMFGALRDPAVRDAYRTAKNKTIDEMSERGVVFYQNEMREITGTAAVIGGVKQLGDMPWGIGKATRRAEVTFNTFLDVLRIEYWEGMRPLLKQVDGVVDPDELNELAAITNKLTGSLDPSRAGISNHQRTIESTYMMFAPMLRRSVAALIFKAGEGAVLTPLSAAGAKHGGKSVALGLERRVALQAIGSMMAACGMMAYMLHASGNNKKVFDTESADFMSAKIGGVRVGIGTPFYALARMGSGIFHNLKEEPMGLLKWDIEDHPVLKMTRSMTSPVTGTAIDLIHGRNFIGDPMRDSDGGWEKLKILRYLGRQGMPFWAETVAYDFQGYNKLGFFGEIAGLRTSPLPKSTQLQQLRMLYLNGDIDDPELVTWRNRQIARGEPVTPDEAPAMVIDRLASRHEDIKELEEDLETSRLFRGDTESKKITKYIEAMEANRKKSEDSFLGHAVKFDNGEIDGRIFRALVRDTSAELRGAQEGLSDVFDQVIQNLDAKRLGRLKAGQGYVGDLLYDRYRAQVTDNPGLEDEFGNFLPDEYKKAELDFREWVNDEDVWEYIQRRKTQNKNLPPTVAALYDARETLQPYWAIHDQIWRGGSRQHTLMVNYNRRKTKLGKEAFKKEYPAILVLLQQQTKRKLAWRRANPAGDAALVRFYDYNPVQRGGL